MIQKDVIIRDFKETDTNCINRIAVEAFTQFQDNYNDWLTMSANLSKMSELSKVGQVIVAEIDRKVIGGVAYIPSYARKADYFHTDWPVIRMLVVSPAARENGVGRLLTEECILRAKNEGAETIALHTTTIMTVALPMYLRMGFRKHSNAPAIFGVTYAVYTKSFHSN